MTHRILIVDDDLHIREVIRVALKKAGMTVSEARDGKEALSRFPNDRPDLVVLDIGMPELDGLDVCREIRKSSDVPILFLSARDEEIDRILGLEIGGDDYVTKPFSPRELVARVRAILRRSRRSTPVEQLYFDDVAVDFARMAVTRAGAPVALTPQEFKLLKYLAQHPERVISRDQLLSDVWGYDAYPSTRTVDSHILTLRQKLERVPASPAHIVTVHGAGYKFVP